MELYRISMIAFCNLLAILYLHYATNSGIWTKRILALFLPSARASFMKPRFYFAEERNQFALLTLSFHKDKHHKKERTVETNVL